MNEPLEDLKNQLERLPIEDRKELAFFLLDSLHPDFDPDYDPARDEEFTAELLRRENEMLAGDVGVPVYEALTELRKKYSQGS